VKKGDPERMPKKVKLKMLQVQFEPVKDGSGLTASYRLQPLAQLKQYSTFIHYNETHPSNQLFKNTLKYV
jgi:hypothetical protein